MSISDSTQLIDLLRDAQIVKPSVLDDFLKNRETHDPRRLAQQLVEAELLTSWQAKFLLSGRNRLRVSGYLLCDRVSRDALGDLFSATHETLARQVDLLILTASIKRDDQRFQHFLRTSANLTQLDHPRLAHVYDVGEEGGRFYIVSEQVDRLPISDFSPAEILSDYQRALISLDWWQALDYLHQQSLAHGKIDDNAVLIDSAQRGKLSRLAQSLLQSQVLSEDSALELAERTRLDRQNLAKQIDRMLFRENSMAAAIVCQRALHRVLKGDEVLGNREGGEEKQWTTLGQELQELTASLRSNETLMNLPPPAASADDPSLAESAFTATVTANRRDSATAQSTLVQSTFGTKPTTTSKTKSLATNSAGKPLSRAELAKGHSSAETWVRHGLTLAGIGALIAMLSLIWWFNQRDSAGGAASQTQLLEPQSTTENSNPADSNRPSNATQTNAQRQASKPPARDEENVSQPSSPQTGEIAQDRRTQRTDAPNPSDSAGSELDPKASPKSNRDSKSKPQQSMSPPSESTAETDNSTAKPQTASATDPTKSKSEKPDPFQVPGSSSTPPTANVPPQNETSLNPLPNPPSNTGTDAWGQIPTELKLATSELKEPQSLMAWAFDPNQPPTLKLQLHPEVAGKPKLFAELTTISSQPNVWQVELRRRDLEAAPEVVGRFWAKDNQFWFQWADSIEKNNDANYLINGRLRLSQNGTEKVLPLRPTMVLEPIQLTAENFSVKRPIDLLWLPASARVELADLALHPHWQKTQIDDITIPPKVGRRIDFKILEVEQLCWLLIRADLDRRLTLMLDLFSPESKNPLKPEEFSAALARVEQTYAAMVVAQTQAENYADNAPYGSRTKAREAASDARKQTAEYKKIRELALEFQTLVTEQLDKELPLRVIYENEDYSIILAQSGNFSDKVEEPKSRTRSDR